MFVLENSSFGELVHMPGKQHCCFLYCLPSHWGQLIKERICSARANSFSFRVAPFLKVSLTREANRKTLKLFPFLRTNAENTEMYLFMSREIFSFEFVILFSFSFALKKRYHFRIAFMKFCFYEN